MYGETSLYSSLKVKLEFNYWSVFNKTFVEGYFREISVANIGDLPMKGQLSKLSDFLQISFFFNSHLCCLVNACARPGHTGQKELMEASQL